MNDSLKVTAEPIPFVDLAQQHQELAAEILPVWSRILEQAAFIGGPEVEGFEKEFAAFTRSEFAIGVGSGTAALRLALQAAGVQPGDEIIVPAQTFIATVEAVTQAGAVPRMADVESDTATLDPAAVEATITPATRWLLPVHLYGHPAEMDSLTRIAEQHGLGVIEDAAQAHGAEYRGRKVGSLGRAAAFSFYPGKNLGACGEAGAITTGDGQIDSRARMLRDHGQSEKYRHAFEGTNARLDALQAAALRIKLARLDGWNARRMHIGQRYFEGLAGSSLLRPIRREDCTHVYHQFVLRHPERDRVRETLTAAGIASGLHYPIPIHLQPAYASLGHRRGDFPQAERWADEGLSLPVFPSMRDDQVDRVCDVLREFGG